MCICIVYLKKKEFCSYFPSSFSIYFWQEPFAWRYWQSCQSLLQPFWHGSSSQQRATHQWPPRVNAGRSWSSKQQRVWHLAIQFSQSFVWTNHQSTFVFPFLPRWASLLIRLFTAATDLLPIRGPGNHCYSDYSFFLQYFTSKIPRAYSWMYFSVEGTQWLTISPKWIIVHKSGVFHLLLVFSLVHMKCLHVVEQWTRLSNPDHLLNGLLFIQLPINCPAGIRGNAHNWIKLLLQ